MNLTPSSTEPVSAVDDARGGELEHCVRRVRHVRWRRGRAGADRVGRGHAERVVRAVDEAVDLHARRARARLDGGLGGGADVRRDRVARIGLSPSPAGAVHSTWAAAVTGRAITFLGAVGATGLSGVTALDWADSGPLPAGLTACTVKRYVVPFVRPVTVVVVGGRVHRRRRLRRRADVRRDLVGLGARRSSARSTRRTRTWCRPRWR